MRVSDAPGLQVRTAAILLLLVVRNWKVGFSGLQCRDVHTKFCESV
jgi:hypothetical protein